VYAIKACADENLERKYNNRNFYILLDGQAAFKALDKHQISAKLDWDFNNPSRNWPDLRGFN
jgi:hypothetical protein